MKFKDLNESLVSEDKYREFILAMMGELGGSKFFTAGISYDRWFSEAPAEEESFRSFTSAREWCERTPRQYGRDAIAYIVKSNINNIQTEVCLNYNGKNWYFYTGE